MQDNSANMSGKYNGMQAKLCDINPLALYVPCAAHSLHLIGVCAVECCVEAFLQLGSETVHLF